MGSDNEDLDYMSDVFVNNASDVKPGLVTARSIQRSRTAELLSKSNRTLSKAEQEAQRLREGLQKQVGPENKGFAMLAKMGYVQGKGLGKNAEGRAEPVSIEIPSERKGLGFAKAQQDRLKAKLALKNMQQVLIQNDFRTTMATRFRLGQLNRQLKAARHICQRLDLEESVDSPVNRLFWPVEDTEPEVQPKPVRKLAPKRKCKSHSSREPKRPPNPDLDRTDEFAPEEDDFGESEDEDLADFDEAGSDMDIGSDPSAPNAFKVCTLDESQPQQDEAAVQRLYGCCVQSLLDDLLSYLRGRHHYCFWCSHHYQNRSELLAECPGPTEDEHG